LIADLIMHASQRGRRHFDAVTMMVPSSFEVIVDEDVAATCPTHCYSSLTTTGSPMPRVVELMFNDLRALLAERRDGLGGLR
jgi:hypothetical protein